MSKGDAFSTAVDVEGSEGTSETVETVETVVIAFSTFESLVELVNDRISAPKKLSAIMV